MLSCFCHSAAAPATLASLASSRLRTTGPAAIRSASRFAARFSSGLRPARHRGRFAAQLAPPLLPPAPPLPPPPPLGSALIASLLASLVAPLASPLCLWSARRAQCVSVHVEDYDRAARPSPPLRPAAPRHSLRSALVTTAFAGGEVRSPLAFPARLEGPPILALRVRSRRPGLSGPQETRKSALLTDSCLLPGASHPFGGAFAASPVPSRHATASARTSKGLDFFEARSCPANLLRA